MKQDSAKMSDENWQRLTEVAAATNSLYSGSPSWRRLMLRIARGDVRCTEAPKSKRPRRNENVQGHPARDEKTSTKPQND